MKYRYITSGIAKPDDPVKAFRLITGKTLGQTGAPDALRISLPDDAVLKRDAAGYDLLTSHRDLTVRDCAPVAYVKRNGRFRAMKDLWPAQPHEWLDILRTRDGLFPVPGKGYVKHVPRHSGRRGGETAPGESS